MKSLEPDYITPESAALHASITLLEEEREILREQIISFRQELAIANREKCLLRQEIAACNQELREISQTSQELSQELFAERQAKQLLEQAIEQNSGLNSYQMFKVSQVNFQQRQKLYQLWAQAQGLRREAVNKILYARQVQQEIRQERELYQHSSL